MERKQRSIWILGAIMGFVGIGLFVLPYLVRAGDLNLGDVLEPTMKTPNQLTSTSMEGMLASKRFEDVKGMDGEALLDNETGLVWAKNANISSGPMGWDEAVAFCQNLSLGGQKGWRLPTLEELGSLLYSTSSNSHIFFPGDNPFSNVNKSFYWSATANDKNTRQAWGVQFDLGQYYYLNKEIVSCVWPVRDNK